MSQLMVLIVLVMLCSTAFAAPPATQPIDGFVLDYDTPVDAALQQKLETVDAELRAKLDMTSKQTNIGLLDLLHPRVAMINPDHTEYAASVAKVGILYAYFKLHPEAATNLDPTVRHELRMMAKISSNEMASKYSHEIGLKKIQEILNADGFYDEKHGGGIWVGKHYGKGTERFVDPVSGNSHAINVRQMLRFWLLLEQNKLVSPAASVTMRELFASPDLPADDIKFVKALKDRPGVKIIRKWGTWENWLHDTAVIEGPGRKYILVGITDHPKGDEYLEGLAVRVDEVMKR
jgi:beta-lactamase class A